MGYSLQLLLLVILCLVPATGGDTCIPTCDHSNSTRFGFDPADPAALALGCQGYRQCIYCCVSGLAAHSPIEWQYCGKDTKTGCSDLQTTPYLKYRDASQQVLIFTAVDKREDNGYYRCMAQKEGKETISNTVQLSVTSKSTCDGSTGPPQILSPTENQTVLVQPGQTVVSLSCTMWFHMPVHNCSTYDENLQKKINWAQLYPNGTTRWIKESITQSMYDEQPNEACISVLQIKKFSDKDYGTYFCINNNGMGSNNRIFYVAEQVDELDQYQLVLLLLLSILLAASLFGAILWMKRLELQIWWKTRVFMMPTHSPDVPYQVLLLYPTSTDEKRFAEEFVHEKLHTVLPDKGGGYSVQSCDDLLGDYVTAYASALESCACVVAVVSPAMLKDPHVLLCLTTTIAEKHVVLICYQEIPESAWQTTHDAESLRLALGTDRVLYWKPPHNEKVSNGRPLLRCCVRPPTRNEKTPEKQLVHYEIRFIKRLHLMLLKLGIHPWKGTPLESRVITSNPPPPTRSGEDLPEDPMLSCSYENTGVISPGSPINNRVERVPVKSPGHEQIIPATAKRLNAPTQSLNAPSQSLNAPSQSLNAPSHSLNAPSERNGEDSDSVTVICEDISGDTQPNNEILPEPFPQLPIQISHPSNKSFIPINNDNKYQEMTPEVCLDYPSLEEPLLA